MKRVNVITLLITIIVLFSGCTKSKQKFNLSEFGFENNNGMCKWIQITDYNFENGYAEFCKEKAGQYILEFKEHTVLSSYCTGNNAENVSKKLQTFQVLDNNSALIDNKPILITERITENNMLIIKIFRKNSEHLFILENTVTAIQNENGNTYYYFEN